MRVICIQIEETVNVGVDLACEATLDALTHHRALLARDRLHVGFDARLDRLSKGDEQILLRPPALVRRAITQLKMIDSEIARQVGRRCMQHAARVLIVHGGPAVHRERQRHERMPKEQALDLRQAAGHR